MIDFRSPLLPLLPLLPELMLGLLSSFLLEILTLRAELLNLVNSIFFVGRLVMLILEAIRLECSWKYLEV
jgi:hypothetical protein